MNLPGGQSCIVVPCFNEEKRLATAAFEDFLKTTPDVDFIFVNDGSSDGTQQVIESLVVRWPARVTALEMDSNAGKAEACRRGLKAAFAKNYAFVGFWDADLATPLAEVPRFLSHFRNPVTVMVVGSRVKLLGRRIERKASRHYLGRVFATLASCSLRLPVYDTQCGAKIFRNVREISTIFEMPFHGRWTFDLEIFHRFVMAAGRDGDQVARDGSIVEHPVMEWVDKKDSRLSGFEFARIAWEFLVFLLTVNNKRQAQVQDCPEPVSVKLKS